MEPSEIRLLRKNLGFTQKEFADILCCNEDTVSGWERDKSEPEGLIKCLLEVMSEIPKLDPHGLGNLRVHLRWALEKGGIAEALLEMYRVLFALAHELENDEPKSNNEVFVKLSQSKTMLAVSARTEEFVEQVAMAHEDKRRQ